MRTLLFLVLLLPISLGAQPDSTTRANALPRLTLKLNSGALLNPFKQAAAFATDIRLAPRISVDLGAGAFLNSTIFAETKGESYRGLRLRAGFKYHLLVEDASTFYIGAEGKYQDIKHMHYQEVFRQGLQYLEILSLKRTVRTSGAAVRIGWQFHFGKNLRWILEQSLGMGMDVNQVSQLLPPDAELVPEERFINFELPEGRSQRLALLYSIHFGVLLW